MFFFKLYNKKLILEFFMLNLIIFITYILMNYFYYFLNFLIGMEFLISMILFYMIMINYNSWIFLIYLIYSVCEGILGLSLMVSMNYEFGHQKINFFNLY